MPILNSLAAVKDESAGWRRELHQNPQTAYEETFASGFVEARLKQWGIPYKKGLAKTGIVATIEGQKNSSGKALALRADMDALDILEKTGLPHASKNPGKMHACGHDGHTATLLTVARYLQETRAFNGRVHLIFQPAEEGGNGAGRMIDEGLFKDFPCDYVFGVHNWPSLAIGKVGMRTGPLLASVDEFRIRVEGAGGHAAMPHQTLDPIVVTSQIVTALQSIVSRNVDPIDTVVVSTTNFNSGTGAFNVIPDTAELVGTIRTFNNDTRDMVVARMKAIVDGIARSMGCRAEVNVLFHNAATVNTADGIAIARRAAARVVGEENVDTDFPPNMGGEDFGAYLRQKPGAFVIIGQGVADKDSPHNKGLHHPGYDFNDDMIPVAASYFAALVDEYLPLKG